MLISLRYLDSQAADLPAQVTWRTPAAREAGTLRCHLPRRHPLFASQVWTDRGSFTVSLNDARLGTWFGISQTVTVDASGVTIEAVDFQGWAAQRPVLSDVKLNGVSAGVAAKLAMQDALTGLAAASFTIGAVVDGPPLLNDYQWQSGSTLGDILAGLTDRSGQEWTLDATRSVLTWGPPLFRVYPGHLSEPGDIRNLQRQVDSSSVVTAITATNGTDSYRAEARDVATLFPKEDSISVIGAEYADLALAAEIELAKRREPIIDYQFDVNPLHYALREGDTVRLLLPSAGVDGEAVSARILGRSYDGKLLTATARRLSSINAPKLSGAVVTRPTVVSDRRDVIRRVLALQDRVAALEAAQN